MNRRRDIQLWVGAFALSVAVHGALAATLALAPKPRRVEPPTTNVAVQSLARAVPEAVSAAPVPRAEPERGTVEAVSAPEAAARIGSTEIAAAPIISHGTSAAVNVAAVTAPVREAEIAPSVVEISPNVAGVKPIDAAQQPASQAEELTAAMMSVPADVAGATQTAAPVAVESEITVSDVAPDLASNIAVEPEVRPDIAAPPTVPLASENTVSHIKPDPASVAAVEPEVRSGVTASRTIPSALRIASAPSTATAAAPSALVATTPIMPRTDAVALGDRGTAAAAAPVPPAAAGAEAAFASANIHREMVTVPSAMTLPAIQPAASIDQPTARRPGLERPETQVAMQPARPERPVVEAQPLTDPMAEVRNVIAGQPDATCFLALATPSPQAIAVDGYAERQERLQRLHNDLAVISAVSVNTRQHRITSAQCEALSFAHAVSPDPVARLPITSDSAEISSGAELSGAIHNFSRKWLYLVVVDDEGKVQELQDLSRKPDGTIGFRAPLTLTDGPVDTVQLLLAVASDDALETFASREGDSAPSYFAALKAEISDRIQDVDVGIAGFVIR